METMHKMRARTIQILGILITCLSIPMTIIGAYRIVTCYFFNKPSTISEGLLACSFTWMILPVSTYVFGKRDHMRMGFLADRISGSIRKYLEATTDLLTSAFAGIVMVCGGISITKLTIIQITASLRAPMGYIYVAVPATDVIIMIFNLMNVVDILHADFSKKEDVGV